MATKVIAFIVATILNLVYGIMRVWEVIVALFFCIIIH